MPDEAHIIRPDEDWSNADWTKGSWDFPGRTPEQVASLLVGLPVDQVARLPLMVRNPERAARVLAILARLDAQARE